jgi:hypothetical protein
MRADDRTEDASLEALAPALLGRLPRLLDEVRRQLAAEWPDYAEFLAEEHAEVAEAAKGFMRWLVEFAEVYLSEPPGDLIPTPSTPVALFEEIGRVQWREGRELSTLLSAYQVGARVAWHHVSSIALEVGITRASLAALAEAVFAYVDELSSASARGFVMEQSEAAVTRERLRDDLVELLLSDRSDSAAVRAAAIRAGWPLPSEVAVILIEPDNPVAEAMLARFDSFGLIFRRQQLLGAIIPDPARPGRRPRLAAALRGSGAVIGHPVPLEQLPASIEIVEIANRLRRTGTLTDDPVFVAEHLDAIIVHRDARLLDALRRQCLAPLSELAPAVRQRLSDTLAAWLRHLGDRQAVAAELHIHPQTVRYRMSQLHELFGSALDDPAGRTRLTLALAWGTVGADEPDVPGAGRSATGAPALVRGRSVARPGD